MAGGADRSVLAVILIVMTTALSIVTVTTMCTSREARAGLVQNQPEPKAEGRRCAAHPPMASQRCRLRPIVDMTARPSMWSAHAGSTEHSGYRRRGEYRTLRPGRCVPADMSSADDRVSGRNRSSAWFRNRLSRTESLVVPFSWSGGVSRSDRQEGAAHGPMDEQPRASRQT